MRAPLSWFLERSGLAWVPVRILTGYLKGARWTLWPYSSYWRREYEPDIQASLTRHPPSRGASAWDIGSHFGFYSLWFARAVGIMGEVAAFEPDPYSFRRLSRHIELNPRLPIHAFNTAAGDQNGSRQLIRNRGAGAPTSHFPYPREHPADADCVPVQVVRLDTFATRQNLRQPSIVKIDVEGHAAEVLRGAEAIIRTSRPRFLVSIHSPAECEGVRQALAPHEYQPYALGAGERLGWDDSVFRTVWYCPLVQP